jgi:polar amino acid transport system substrate-binding protein
MRVRTRTLRVRTRSNRKLHLSPHPQLIDEFPKRGRTMSFRHITFPVTLALASGLALSGCGAQASGTAGPASPSGSSASPAGLADGIPTEAITTTENKNLSAKLPAGFGDTLTDAIDLSSPPARLIDAEGKPAGFNVDFSKLLSQKLGLTDNVVNVPFSQIIPGLAAKRYDVSINNFSRTPEREAQVDMIEYMQGSGGLAVPAANPNKVNETPTSLCGLHLGVLSGSYQENTTVPQINKECEAKGLEKVEFTAYGTNNEAILALGSRRIEAWIGNGTVAAYAAARQPEVFKSMTLTGTWSHDNISLPKGSALTPVVAEAVQELMDEGTYKKVLEKWGIPQYALDKTSLVQTPVTQQ